MSDDKSNRGGQDRKRIDVNPDYELRDWSRKFGVTPEELKKAVAEVGDRSDKVEERLSDRKGPKRVGGGQFRASMNRWSCARWRLDCELCTH